MHLCRSSTCARVNLHVGIHPASGLFDIVEMNMNAPSDMEKLWNELEHKHHLRCLWQQVDGRMIVECLWVPSAGVSIIVCKHYDGNIKGKKWPQMTAHYAYFPAGGVTWEEMDQALEAIKKQDAA